MRARNFASRKLLAASRPVEAQLSIQTRAISSYSSVRAGRIVGGGIQTVPDSGVAVSGAKKKPPRQYREGFFNSIKCGSSLRPLRARRHPSAAARFQPPWGGRKTFPPRSPEAQPPAVHHLAPPLLQPLPTLLLRLPASIHFRPP